MLDPQLLDQWAAELNAPLSPDTLRPNSHRVVWWRCEKGHVWRAAVKSRTGGSGCPYCANRAVLPGENDLASQFPKLAAEWDTERNRRPCTRARSAAQAAPSAQGSWSCPA